MPKYTALLLLITFYLFSSAQNNEADKLKSKLGNENLSDSLFLSFALQIANLSVQTSPDTGMKYALLALDRAQSLHLSKEQMMSCKVISIAQAIKGDYKDAIETINKGIKLYQSVPAQEPVLSDLYNNLGIIYYRNQKLQKSLEAYLLSMQLSKKSGNNAAYIRTKVNLNNIYTSLLMYDKAISNNEELIEIIKTQKKIDTILLGVCNINIANALWKKKFYKKAMTYMREAYALHEPKNYYDGMINELGTFAEYEKLNKQYNKSIEYLQKSLTYSRKINHAETLTRSFISLSDNYRELGDSSLARIYLDSADQVATQTTSKELKKHVLDARKKMAIKKEDFKTAYLTQLKQDSIKETILNEQSLTNTQELITRYDVREKEEKIIQQENTLKLHRWSLWIFLLLSAVGVFTTYLLYRYFRRQSDISKQKAQELAIRLDQAYREKDSLMELFSASEDVEDERAVTEVNTNTHMPLDTLFLIINDKVKIPYKNIYCIESAQNDIKIFGEDDKTPIQQIRFTLKRVKALLPDNFVKVQRSYIANLHYLQKVEKKDGKQFIILKNGIEISVTENIEEILSKSMP